MPGKFEVDARVRDGRWKDLPPGSGHYRAYIGSGEVYDLVGAIQFSILTFLGLREHHFLLDIGCGSLRGGKLFIPYLLPGRYFGIEPEQWLIEEGIRNEVGKDLIDIKQPVLSNDRNFTLSAFDQQFDFILAHSIFSHASQQQIRTCLSEAKNVMGPASVFAATFVRGQQNYTGSRWVYPHCVTYTLEHIAGLAEAHGLICKPIDWPHPTQQTWVIICHPENSKAIPDIDDTTRLLWLENELKFYKQRLAKLEGHPYVRFGMKVDRYLPWVERLRHGYWPLGRNGR